MSDEYNKDQEKNTGAGKDVTGATIRRLFTMSLLSFSF